MLEVTKIAPWIAGLVVILASLGLQKDSAATIAFSAADLALGAPDYATDDSFSIHLAADASAMSFTSHSHMGLGGHHAGGRRPPGRDHAGELSD